MNCPTDASMHIAKEGADACITAAEIQAAIEGRQFRLCYHPKVECESLILKGFEVLIRWEHPTRGLVMPDQFIRVAEDAGLIGKITEIVVDEAFAWYLATPGVRGLWLSINMSVKRLSDADFAAWLFARCRAVGIKPDCIYLEISETAVMTERLHAYDMFNRLLERGFRVAIDNFGVGKYSLSILARLPFSEVKIERSFGMTAGESEESRAFIKATVDLAHRMALSVVAEGVEDRVTLEFLRHAKCDYIQGYLVTRPMTSEQTQDWMLNRRQMTKHMLI